MSLPVLQFQSYSEYLQTDHWRKIRSEAIKRARGRCALCGHTDRPLQVHHTDDGYDALGEELPEMLLVLCARCHESFSLGRLYLEGVQ